MIDWIEDGAVPKDQLSHSRYADLVTDPIAALEKLYGQLGLPLTDQAGTAVQTYLAGKPKGKFGAHHYAVDSEDRTRALFARYQSKFDVPTED